MKTVVTGGAGFIGSHLVHELVARGREVLVIDDLSRGRRENLAHVGGSVDVRVEDLRHYDRVAHLFGGATCVFHMAARVGSVEFLHGTTKAELNALQTNLVIDTNVFRACLEAGVATIIYASSVSVYPIDRQNDDHVEFSEEDLSYVNPDGGYGWAKFLGETQLQWMQGVRVGIARIFGVYGEGEEPDIHAHVVPALAFKAVLHPDVEYRVWGDGNQSRDLLHVKDVVEVLLRLETKASSPPVIVNVGSGGRVTVRSLVEKLIEISGKSINPIYDSQALVGPRSRIAEISRARRILDWEPTISLEEGLRRTYAWVESRLKSVR